MDIRRASLLAAACLLLLALPATAADDEPAPCRVEDCPTFRVIRFYEELGCVRSDGAADCCPTRFDCSAVTSLNKTQCHYRGKAYDPGTQIQEEIKSICTPTCTCVADTEGTFSGESNFECAHIDCPEYFASEPPEPACYRQYKVDQCCSTGLECGNSTEGEGRQEVLECVYNGRTFLEGQYIEVPENECLACVCEEGFNGTLDGPWCRKYSCDFTLGQRPSELTTCAPIFWRTRKCCPMSWHCPSPHDRMIGRSEPPAENEGCTFGTFRLNIGGEIRTGRAPCIKCKCEIPPYVTCAQLPETECESLDI